MSTLRSRECKTCSLFPEFPELGPVVVSGSSHPRAGRKPRPFTAIGCQRLGQYNRLWTHGGGRDVSTAWSCFASETQTDLTRHPVCGLCKENTRTHTPILSAKLGEGACIVCQLGGSRQFYFVASYSAAWYYETDRQSVNRWQSGWISTVSTVRWIFTAVERRGTADRTETGPKATRQTERVYVIYTYISIQARTPRWILQLCQCEL